MIFVNTRGGAADCSAVAETVRLVRGSRFFLRIETTSTDVQLQSANKTASIGEGPLACRSPASKTTLWPLSECPSNSISFVQTVSAIIALSPGLIEHQTNTDPSSNYSTSALSKI